MHQTVMIKLPAGGGILAGVFILAHDTTYPTDVNLLKN